MSRISLMDFEKLSTERLPFAGQLGYRLEIIDHGFAIARAPYREDFLRPGGTISGPVLMGLADFAMYGAVLSMIGPVELAVTINLNINFLRRPPPGDILAEARVLKLGKRLAVGEVGLRRDADDDLVAHVTCTYSIPPDVEGV